MRASTWAGTTLFIHVARGRGVEGAPNADHVAFALDQDAAAERARSGGRGRGRAEGLLLGPVGLSDGIRTAAPWSFRPKADEALGEARIVGKQLLDLRPGDRKAADVGHGPHSRCALDVVAEQRALAEDVPGPERARSLGRFDDRLALCSSTNMPEPGLPRSISAWPAGASNSDVAAARRSS